MSKMSEKFLAKTAVLLMVVSAATAMLSLTGCGGDDTSDSSVSAKVSAAVSSGSVDFGPNVFIFDPNSTSAEMQAKADEIFAQQETNQFGTERYAVMFKPGNYNVKINVGFYTSIMGLGKSPDDVVITGSARVEADWRGGFATQNFWRSVENFSIIPTVISHAYQEPGSETWAVAQAAPFRRMHIRGGLSLWDPVDPDRAWASGGYIADSIIDGMVLSASQQQFYTRNSRIGSWPEYNWNIVFQGVENAPSDTFPDPPVTSLPNSPVISEKPFLYVDENDNYFVKVPDLKKNSSGITWASGETPGESIPLSDFYIVKENTDNAATINAALALGKHLLVTPGIYHLTETINVTKKNTIVLGMGFATFIPENGIVAMKVADVDGVKIAGLLFDAGTGNSPVMLEVGPDGSGSHHTSNPTCLYDLFFRIGGTSEDAIGKADVSLKINSNDVIGDHFWIWRADHGAKDINPGGTDPSVGWDKNTARNGLVANGDDITMYGLFVEHFQEYQTLWNGNGGRVYFYQCELPYDPPSQAEWMNGSVKGYAGYKVASDVISHEVWGLGIYCFFKDDHSVELESAMEVPQTNQVAVHHVTTTCFLQVKADGTFNGNGGILHLVNQAGPATRNFEINRISDYEYTGGVDFSALNSAINSANLLRDGTPVGTSAGCVSQADADKYGTAINAAYEVAVTPTDIQGVVDAAVDALAAATEEFTASIIQQGYASYEFEGVLTNGMFDGLPVDYRCTAVYTNGIVTVSFDSGDSNSFVWCYTPGFNSMTNISGTRWEVKIAASPGDVLTWYFLANKNGQEANNAGNRHTWTVGSGSVVLFGELNDAITAANILKNNVPVGTTAGCVPQSAASAFSTAISAASAVASNSSSSQSQVDAAIVKLDTATQVFRNAIIGTTGGYVFEGVLPNGLIYGEQVNYKCTAAYSNGKVTISFDSDSSNAFVWCYTPGFNSMSNVSGTRWEVQFTGSPGQQISWYFLANSNGQEANNAGSSHTWVIE